MNEAKEKRSALHDGNPEVEMNACGLFRLDGDKAVVVGGASGIGKAIASMFCEAGAEVAVADIDMEAASRTAVELGNRRAIAVQVDVADAESVQAMVTDVKAKFGAITVLVNSAGINRRVPAEELLEDDWDAVIDINLKGSFLTCQRIGREMLRQKNGRIVNIASMSGLVTNKGKTNTAYCSSKGGVVMLTKSLAVEWAKNGIRVNAIAPGYVKTPLTRPWMENSLESNPVLDLIPMGRFGEPCEVAAAALYLAAPASSYLTGAILMVDGGYTCY